MSLTEAYLNHRSKASAEMFTSALRPLTFLPKVRGLFFSYDITRFPKSPENFVWVYLYKTGALKGGMPLFLAGFSLAQFRSLFPHLLAYFDRLLPLIPANLSTFLATF